MGIYTYIFVGNESTKVIVWDEKDILRKVGNERVSNTCNRKAESDLACGVQGVGSTGRVAEGWN